MEDSEFCFSQFMISTCSPDTLLLALALFTKDSSGFFHNLPSHYFGVTICGLYSEMGFILGLILQLLKLCIIGFVVAFEGSQGSMISPSPAFLPVIHPSGEAPDPIHLGLSSGSSPSRSPSDPNGFVLSPSPKTIHVDPSPAEAPNLVHPKEPWRTIAPSPQEVPNGSFLPPLVVTLPPPKSPPTPEKTKEFESSISPSPGSSTITSSPSRYTTAPGPSTAEGNVSPSIQLSPPQSKTPTVSPPVTTPIAPGNLPKTSPVSQPIEHGSLPPKMEERNKSHKPEPAFPAVVPIPSTELPKYSPASQPTENGSLPHREVANNSHIPEPISPGM
ncbi:unnamed protein product [Sphenostylis stenocarpa]|uniref:Uncharacterized protein n=1 Tax=Sphenostylis stenocarpa TaxID=92480 RepID=A0AA86SZL1_9FABA|nr:unnamed protein product [Sphenostylis stenocarpa]